MKRPPFKITDANDCQVRYTDHRGRQQVRSGRRSFVINRVWLWNIAVRDYGTDYEARVKHGPWHKLYATQAEARAIFEASDATRRLGLHLPWRSARRASAR